jgi:hypothetical protein
LEKERRSTTKEKPSNHAKPTGILKENMGFDLAK